MAVFTLLTLMGLPKEGIAKDYNGVFRKSLRNNRTPRVECGRLTLETGKTQHTADLLKL